MENRNNIISVTRRDFNIDRRRDVYVTEIKYNDLVISGWGYISQEAEKNASRRWKIVKKDLELKTKEILKLKADASQVSAKILTNYGNIPFSYVIQITERR